MSQHPPTAGRCAANFRSGAFTAGSSSPIRSYTHEHSDEYYRHTGGDKDTFHLAWRRLGRPYGLIPHHVQALGNHAMLQHDFNGEVVFQHRNQAKWKLDVKANPRVDGFRDEERCLEILRELAAHWTEDPTRSPPDTPQAGRLHDEIVATGSYVYDRIGFDRRVIRLRADQGIDGGGGLEASWFVETRDDGVPVLCIASGNAVTCLLAPRGDGALSGRWEVFERMPIELLPLSLVASQDRLQIEREARHQDFYTFVETGVAHLAAADERPGHYAIHGQSTLLFDQFVGAWDGVVYSVDSSALHCARARAWASAKVRIFCHESRTFLAGFNPPTPIDCLYLDSLDVDPNDPHPSALHHLEEDGSPSAKPTVVSGWSSPEAGGSPRGWHRPPPATPGAGAG